MGIGTTVMEINGLVLYTYIRLLYKACRHSTGSCAGEAMSLQKARGE